MKSLNQFLKINEDIFDVEVNAFGAAEQLIEWIKNNLIMVQSDEITLKNDVLKIKGSFIKSLNENYDEFFRWCVRGGIQTVIFETKDKNPGYLKDTSYIESRSNVPVNFYGIEFILPKVELRLYGKNKGKIIENMDLTCDEATFGSYPLEGDAMFFTIKNSYIKCKYLNLDSDILPDLLNTDVKVDSLNLKHGFKVACPEKKLLIDESMIEKIINFNKDWNFNELSIRAYFFMGKQNIDYNDPKNRIGLHDAIARSNSDFYSPKKKIGWYDVTFTKNGSHLKLKDYKKQA